MNKFNAEQLLQGFLDQCDFPREDRHSGEVYISHDLKEYEENDSAFGEYWANYLDSEGYQADFDWEDLENGGDDVLFKYWFDRMAENFVNGNKTAAMSEFEELKDQDENELLCCLEVCNIQLSLLRAHVLFN